MCLEHSGILTTIHTDILKNNPSGLYSEVGKQKEMHKAGHPCHLHLQSPIPNEKCHPRNGMQCGMGWTVPKSRRVTIFFRLTQLSARISQTK